MGGNGLTRGMTRSFNRPASNMTGIRVGSAMRDIEEESEYSPQPIRLVQRVPLVSALDPKYPKLGEAEINKVNNAFSKIFAPVFSGYRDYIIDKHLQKAGPGHIFMEIQEKLVDINEKIIQDVVGGLFDTQPASTTNKAAKKKLMDQSMYNDDDSFEEERVDFDDSSKSSNQGGKRSKPKNGNDRS